MGAKFCRSASIPTDHGAGKAPSPESLESCSSCRNPNESSSSTALKAISTTRGFVVEQIQACTPKICGTSSDESSSPQQPDEPGFISDTNLATAKVECLALSGLTHDCLAKLDAEMTPLEKLQCAQHDNAISALYPETFFWCATPNLHPGGSYAGELLEREGLRWVDRNHCRRWSKIEAAISFVSSVRLCEQFVNQ